MGDDQSANQPPLESLTARQLARVLAGVRLRRTAEAPRCTVSSTPDGHHIIVLMAGALLHVKCPIASQPTAIEDLYGSPKTVS